MPHKDEELVNRLLAYIEKFWELKGESPTNQMIADGTGVSTATVSRYLQYLRELGRVDYHGHSGYRIKTKRTGQQRNMTPIVGDVSCGVPKLAEENIEDYVMLPTASLGTGNFYLLHAKGNSMVEIGIDDGDLVLIRQTDEAETGQIVVALTDDGEATLKRYYPEPENSRVRLHPENSSMEDIYVDNCIIQGVAVKVLKDLT